MIMPEIFLILGGVRSGKSVYAENIAENIAKKAGQRKIYLATAATLDVEMEARVKTHRLRRDDSWQTIEEQVEISKIIDLYKTISGTIILVDCLTLWLSNIMHLNMDIMQQIDVLVTSLKNAQCTIILVSGEVGMGIVPENALSRQFCDYLGIINQQIAKIAGKVVLVVAGMPVIVKGA